MSATKPYRVRVLYEVDLGADAPHRYATTCLIVPGYSTEADITKMIAVRHWGKAERAGEVKVLAKERQNDRSLTPAREDTL